MAANPGQEKKEERNSDAVGERTQKVVMVKLG